MTLLGNVNGVTIEVRKLSGDKLAIKVLVEGGSQFMRGWGAGGGG